MEKVKFYPPTSPNGNTIKYLMEVTTLDSGIDVAPGITVVPPHKKFHVMILILFYINLGIAVILYIFSSKFSKM